MATPQSSPPDRIKSPQRLGLTIASYGIRWRSRHPHKFKNALEVLEHGRTLGSGGLQISIGDWEPSWVQEIRDYLDKHQLYLEGQVALPRDKADLARFDRRIQIAREAGAKIVRTVMLGGRRYETFRTAESFRQFAQRSWRSLIMAESVVRKHGILLALENHKDWRVDEMLQIMDRTQSEHVGICVDTGNSIALLEDPMLVVGAYASRALTVHFKDMAVAPYPDGFLLAEVPLGRGFLNLTGMVKMLRQARPEIQFNLEMITRDPLKVPCLNDSYWPTMTHLTAQPLAHTLDLVRRHPSPHPLPQVSGLEVQAKIDLEESHVQESFQKARQQLEFS